MVLLSSNYVNKYIFKTIPKTYGLYFGDSIIFLLDLLRSLTSDYFTVDADSDIGIKLLYEKKYSIPIYVDKHQHT